MGVINLGLLVEKIAKKLSAGGFIKESDYATSSKAGTVRMSATNGISTASQNGVLQPATKTAEQYAAASNNLFISKGTLDALIAAGTLGGSSLAFGTTESKIGTWGGADLYQKVVSHVGSGTESAALPAGCPMVWLNLFAMNADGNAIGAPAYPSSANYINAQYKTASGDIEITCDNATRTVYVVCLYTKPTTP